MQVQQSRPHGCRRELAKISGSFSVETDRSEGCGQGRSSPNAADRIKSNGLDVASIDQGFEKALSLGDCVGPLFWSGQEPSR